MTTEMIIAVRQCLNCSGSDQKRLAIVYGQPALAFFRPLFRFQRAHDDLRVIRQPVSLKAGSARRCSITMAFNH